MIDRFQMQNDTDTRMKSVARFSHSFTNLINKKVPYPKTAAVLGNKDSINFSYNSRAARIREQDHVDLYTVLAQVKKTNQ